MEYFGHCWNDFTSPVRDVVVGTPPDSLLTLVTQDLPEDIFDDQDDEATAADAIDAVMDSNNAEINLASVSPPGSGLGCPDLSDLIDHEDSNDSETDPASPSSSSSSTLSGDPNAIFEEVPCFFNDQFSTQLDVKEVVVGQESVPPEYVPQDSVILPPTEYIYDSESDTTSAVYIKEEDIKEEDVSHSESTDYQKVCHEDIVRHDNFRSHSCRSDKVRHDSSDSYESYGSSSSPPPALPGSMSLDDLDVSGPCPVSERHVSERKESTVKRPRMSYAQLIAEALMNSSDRRLTLNDIYVHINARHPYYSLKGGKGWQNAVRHNLTLNKSFVKVPRPANEGRGSWWELEAGAEKGIFKRLLRQHYMYKVALDTAKGSSAVAPQTPTSAVGSGGYSPPHISSHHPSSGKPDLPAVKAARTPVRAATVKTVKAKAAPTAGAASNKPQIKIIKSIPLKVSPKVTSAAVTSSSSSKPTIIYVTLPRHLFK